MENERDERKTCLAHLNAVFEHLDANERFDNLNTLIATVMDPHPSQVLSELDFIVKELECIISIFDLKKMDKNMALELFNIMDINMVWKYSTWLKRYRGIFEEWRKPSPKHYPKTGEHGYVDHLVEYLELMLVKAKADHSYGPLMVFVLRIQRMFQLVTVHLFEIPGRRKKDVDFKILMEGITDLAYDTEYGIDLFLVREIPIWYSVFWLQEIENVLKQKLGQLNVKSGDAKLIIREIQDETRQLNKIIAILNNNTEMDEKLDEILEAVRYSFGMSTFGFVSSYKERKKEVFVQLLLNAFNHSYYKNEKKRVYNDDKRVFLSHLSEEALKKLVQDLFAYRRFFIILKDVDDIQDLEDIRKIVGDYGSILLTTHSPELVAYCDSGSQENLFINNMCRDHTKPTIDEDVLGFEKETESMLHKLMEEPKQLRIISIVGMAGQGKTTLAKKLYNDLSVTIYFDTRAWGCVSQEYSKRELLLELLSQLSDAMHLENDQELDERLYQSLMGQRFLIVLDDIWSTQAWNDLRRCFPNQNNGSRIIFTTRQQRLAFEAQAHSMIQPLKPLSNDDSWALLQKKLFQTESFPDELLGIGREIANCCKGLPLSVVLTAGLLAKLDKRIDVWTEFSRNLSSHILKDAKAEDIGIVELSYKNLPDPLKPCFLYIGAFLENREVPIKKLIRLWVAEGFIKHSDSKSLEYVAEDYLADLIGRSMVIVAQEKSNGGVKTCRVHDILREFALTKASQDNFFHQIQESDEQLNPDSEPITPYSAKREKHIFQPKRTMFYRRWLANFSKSNLFSKLRANPKSSSSSKPIAEPQSSCSPNSITYNQRRLCVYSKSNRFFNLRAEPFGPHVRSLLLFAGSEMFPSYSSDISFIFRNFKLLKILNLEDINIGNSFKEIDVLLHLRYLAVQGTMVSVPSSIENLLHLETCSVKSLEDKVIEVPDSIWNIISLRHLHINCRASFDMEPHRLENSFVLDNLQTLSTPSLAYGDDMEKILRKLRGICKLNCIFLDSWNDSTNCNQFPVLEFLTKLESLKVLYNGQRRFPCELNFPSNLKKLTLNNFHMPWNELLQVTRLQNLEILKLVDNAFDGESWEMGSEVVFLNLKFLKLDSLNFVKWIATGDNFPHLENLILHKCQQLEEIPTAIGEIDTLLKITVMWCNSSVAFSAKKIQEEQVEYGNEGLRIHVHPKVWDLESPGIIE